MAARRWLPTGGCALASLRRVRHAIADARFPTPGFPTDDPGLTRAQVRELQQWLAEHGYPQVVADGIMGRNTRDAIEAERAKKGLPPGRRAGLRTYRLLMQP